MRSVLARLINRSYWVVLFAVFFYSNSVWAYGPSYAIIIPNFQVIVNTVIISHVTDDNKNDIFPSLRNGYAVWYKVGDGVYMWDTSNDLSTAQKVFDPLSNRPAELFFANDSSLKSLSSFGQKVAFWGNYSLDLGLNFYDTDAIGLWDGNSTSWIDYNAQKPSLYQDNIAYSKYDGHDYEIIVKKGAFEANVSNNSRNDYSPSLFGETVAWYGNDGNDYEIYYWDGNTKRQLTNNGNDDKYPSLYDGKIAWQGYDGNDWEIYYWNGSQVIQITNNDKDDTYPSLWNGKIAWQGYDGSDYEIYYWDGEKITRVTVNNIDDKQVSLDNGAILWQAKNGSDWDIYYAEIDVPEKPTVSTLSAQDVTQTSAKLRGSVNPNGQATTYHFEWGTSTSYGNVTPDRDAGSDKTSKTVDEIIANLTPGTTYHYRLVAVNPTGTSMGSDRTFTTTAISVTAPVASTGSAEQVTARTAVLTGTLNPQGAETKYRFEYGTDTNYGNTTPWFAAGDGSSEISVNATVNDLQPGTTYHFRLVAENAGGSVEGEDNTFTTEAVSDPMEETRQRFTGWWYDPSQPGTGMAVEIQENNKLFLAWFVYDENGRTTWYASGGSLVNETAYVGQLWKFTGWAWGKEPYSPPTSEVVGSISMVFNKGSNDLINFTATIGDKMVSHNFSSFMKDFAPGDKDSRNLTGWWYDPNYNGMGFYLDARGGKMAMVWYNYRDDHSPRWWTSSAPFADGATTYTGSLDGWMNGQCVGCPFTSPPTVIPGEGGTININFTDANHATVTVGSTTINLQRFVIP